MKCDLNKVIETLITECECDSRIESGVFDLYNANHLIVMTERMELMGLSQTSIEESLHSLVDEGKYPERQAFNKEGWLVTFPSKQYRDAALKKGTHSIADPTHGKGGMNLYYKKKGKQQRQSRQDQTQTDTNLQKAPAPVNNLGGTTTPSSNPPPEDDEPDDNEVPRAPSASQDDELMKYIAAKNPGFKNNRDQKNAAPTSASSALPPSEPQNQTQTSTQTSTQQVEPTTPTPPPITKPDYAKLSKEFSTSKNWVATPYGEWRDKQGNTKAVTGVSGEVVPVENVFRDELKLFVQKNAAAPAAPAPEAPLPPA